MEQERKTWEAKSQTWESKCQELQNKNDKLIKQIIGQLPVKHIIWDTIIAEARKFRLYLDYVLDKEVVIQSSRQIMIASREKLNKKLIDYSNNSIKFLNGLTEDNLKNANIKDIISIITWAREVVNKYHHLDTVQDKIDIMTHQLKLFRDMFDPLFKKGLPLFWEGKGTMLT